MTHGRRHWLSICALLLAALQMPAAASSDPETAPPSVNLDHYLAEWERNMVIEGQRLGNRLLDLPDSDVEKPDNQTLNEVYYDGQLVFYRIADYLNADGADKARWHAYAERARDIYVRGYLEPNDFAAAGYMRFAHGLYTEWRTTGSEEARRRLIRLRDEPAYSVPRKAADWHHHKYSREIAYAIQANVLAEKAGEPRRNPHMSTLVDLALNHVRIWCTGRYVDSDPDWHFVQAFMAGLTATALIEYHEHTPDPRIPPAIRRLADWLWTNMWVADVEGTGHGAFRYVNRAVDGVGDPTPAPDLNMLIAPMYVWLYRETGERAYRYRAELVFAGGVALADFSSGKQFNQNYRNSFDFVRWRREGIQRWEGQRAAGRRR